MEKVINKRETIDYRISMSFKPRLGNARILIRISLFGKKEKAKKEEQAFHFFFSKLIQKNE